MPGRAIAQNVAQRFPAEKVVSVRGSGEQRTSVAEVARVLFQAGGPEATGRRGLAAAPGRPGARPAANLRGKWNIFESDGEPALVA